MTAMENAWYKRNQRGTLGYTFPLNWKGWLHLTVMFAAPAIWLLLVSETGLLGREAWLVALVAFALFFGIGAIGFWKTETVYLP
jgi:hypothetical protein